MFLIVMSMYAVKDGPGVSYIYISVKLLAATKQRERDKWPRRLLSCLQDKYHFYSLMLITIKMLSCHERVLREYCNFKTISQDLSSTDHPLSTH